MGRGPVPKFEKCVNTADLQPKINAQPPFRRANPEGGFISVGLAVCYRNHVLIVIFSLCKPSLHICP